jgi:hypothetical protein
VEYFLGGEHARVPIVITKGGSAPCDCKKDRKRVGEGEEK